MNTLLFEQIFDPEEVNYYDDLDNDETECENLDDEEEYTTVMD